MATPTEDRNRRMLRARDAMDRSFADPLDLRALAAVACVSESHFLREFKATFGETPHRYLQRRRIERAMFLLRTTDTSVTDVCLAVGFASLGTFSRTFSDVVGCSPSRFRAESSGAMHAVPTCFVKSWTRPSEQAVQRTSGFGEAS